MNKQFVYRGFSFNSKGELISDLDDRRAAGVEINEAVWYFYRK